MSFINRDLLMTLVLDLFEINVLCLIELLNTLHMSIISSGPCKIKCSLCSMEGKGLIMIISTVIKILT